MKRRFRVKIGEKVFEVEVEELGREASSIPLPPVFTPPAEKPVTETKPATPKPVEVKAEAGSGIVRAPLPGNVVSIKCREGDRVNAGDPLLVLESMKMENTIYAPKSGVVKRVAVSEGTSVQFGEVLVELE